MTRWFVSRHEGAIEWARQNELQIDRWATHLDLAEIHKDDVVIGTLPVHLAAEVCARGAEFHFLSLNLNVQQRGVELDAAAMQAAKCRLQRYVIQTAVEE